MNQKKNNKFYPYNIGKKGVSVCMQHVALFGIGVERGRPLLSKLSRRINERHGRNEWYPVETGEQEHRSALKLLTCLLWFQILQNFKN